MEKAFWSYDLSTTKMAEELATSSPGATRKHPGAYGVCGDLLQMEKQGQLSEEELKLFFTCMAYMNMRHVLIFATYKEVCKKNMIVFLERVAMQDTKLVSEVNSFCENEMIEGRLVEGEAVEWPEQCPKVEVLKKVAGAYNKFFPVPKPE